MTAIEISRLKELFWYDPTVGVFIRKVRGKGPRNAIGSIPSKANSSGYIRIMIDGVRYQAHRLAVFYQTGAMPRDEVDHRNLVKRDNAFLNLREASHAQNMANQTIRSSNRSGIRGVYWEKTSGKWRASINAGGRRISLGRFETKEQAAAARNVAVTIHHGEFACLR